MITMQNAFARYIDATTANDLKECNLTAASVSITMNGEKIFRKSYGIGADMQPLQENALFRLASMTKPITAFAILILASRGLLKLDDPVSRYLPAFSDLKLGMLSDSGQPVCTGNVKVPLTLRHLLSHTNGLITGELGVKQFSSFPQDKRTSLASVVDVYPICLLSYEPGTQAAYSAVAAFDVLARIIELVSGKSYPDFLKDEIFTPLGMNNTTFTPTDEQWNRMVPMHNKTGKASVFDDMGRHVFENFPLTYPAGGAGLAGTLEDYERFALALLHKGQGLLDPQWIDEMTTPQAKPGIPGLSSTENWGLGVRVITNDPVLDPGCFGWSGAYGTHFWVDPARKLTCVYMKNSRFDGGSEAGTARRLETAVMAALSEQEI